MAVPSLWGGAPKKEAASVKKAFQILWKVIWRFAVACLLMLAVLVGAFISNMLFNNIALYRFSRQLFRHPLPVETTVIEKASACGRFEDTGNGMEFIAVVLVESTLSKEELEAFYNRTAYQHARGDAFPGGEYGPSGPISVRVESAARAVRAILVRRHTSVSISGRVCFTRKSVLYLPV